MTNKGRAILCDTLGILFFGLYAGWSFSLINLIVLFLVQPFLLLPSIFIRPGVVHKNKMNKVIGVILSLIALIIVISGFVGYFVMGAKSADSSQWPFAFKLTLGLCFLTGMVVMLYKLLQDMKIPEEDGR